MGDIFGYKGKKCVVTGTSSGMGKATAELLIELGADVYGMDVVEKEIKGLKFFKANLAEKADIDNVFSQLPKQFDKFFGVAGVSGMKNDFVTTMIINTVANRYIVDKYLLEGERIVNDGAIAICSSIAGGRWQKYTDEYVGMFDAKGSDWEGQVKYLNDLQKSYNGELVGPHAYTVSKRALTYFIKKSVYVAIKRGIRINGIGPGLTETGLINDFKQMVAGSPLETEGVSVIARPAAPKEMAGPLVFLNSDLATYITGEVILVAGGLDADIQAHGHVDIMDYPGLPEKK
ncbi:MAG: SDR family oxidoreductase [Synergistaceae bacterium]|nr:SDR family oxidoreductase [Synergistaceae bacterium]